MRNHKDTIQCAVNSGRDDNSTRLKVDGYLWKNKAVPWVNAAWRIENKEEYRIKNKEYRIRNVSG